MNLLTKHHRKRSHFPCVVCKMHYIKMNSDTVYISAGLDIATPDEYYYHVIDKNVSDSSSLIFKVAACHNAHVLLMKDKDSETNNTNELNIGKLVR